jgi:hypothetical protein
MMDGWILDRTHTGNCVKVGVLDGLLLLLSLVMEIESVDLSHFRLLLLLVTFTIMSDDKETKSKTDANEQSDEVNFLNLISISSTQHTHPFHVHYYQYLTCNDLFNHSISNCHNLS